METLSAMESIPTDQKDRPQSDVIIEDTVVFVNPYVEIDEQVSWLFIKQDDIQSEIFQLKLERERKDKREAHAEKINATVPSAKSTSTKKPVETPTNQVFRSGVGKYISNQA